MEKTSKQKILFIEVIRIVACFLAMVNHTTALYLNPNVYAYTTPPSSWFVSLIYFYICKMAIPLFVMITGYTLLDRQEDYKKHAQRLLRIILVLALFSGLYYINNWMKGTGVSLNIIDYIRALYNGPQAWAYWYMYMYIGLLMMMPFLQKMVANMKKIDCEVMIGISLIAYGLVPIIEYNWPEWTVCKIVDLSLFSSFINIMLIGHYIKHYVEPSKKLFRFSFVVYIAILIFNIVVTCYEFQKNSGINYLFYENRVFITIILQTAFFFYMMKCIKWKEKWAKWITLIGGCTFGMYLLNDFLIEKTMSIFYYMNAAGIHPVISEFIWQIIIFMSSLSIILILKKVPFIKKLL